uniref:hypothetical protein n=1 Tax=Pseudomonas aeruginosa TaxID=287 RepID=UPI00053D09B4
PDNIKGEGPPPELVQAQQTIEQLQGQLSESLRALADLQRDMNDKSDSNKINEYKAITERMDKLLAHIEAGNTALNMDILAQTEVAAAQDPMPIPETAPDVGAQPLM